MDRLDALLDVIINDLTFKKGYLPTEDEVLLFVYGTDEDRSNIWNS